MIWLYTGTPGSGKSLNVAKDIYQKFNSKKNAKKGVKPRVIANFEINKNLIPEDCRSRFYYFDDSILSNPLLLIKFAKKFHVKGIEGQTLLVLDECQLLFNCRSGFSSKDKDRALWIKFFTLHRKLGFNIVLITQMDKMLDKQIRGVVEMEVKHRKVSNFKFAQILPFPLFVAIEYWYGVREKASHNFFLYRKKYGEFYDSYKIFEGQDIVI